MLHWTELWLAILASGVGVFLVSSVIHMVLPLHKSDWSPIPQEESVLDAIREKQLERGQYMFPWCTDMKEMGSPEMLEKYNRGPVGYMTILPNGPMNIGRSLGLWFLYTLLVGVIVAYVASLGVAKGADAMLVFRVTSTVAFAGYAIGVINDTIWKAQRWRVTLTFVFDGTLYALATGAVFTWLWP